MNFENFTLSKNPVLRYLPAVLMMLAIFLFSTGSAVEMSKRLLAMIVNKGGHMIGYGILALTYWRIFEFKGNGDANDIAVFIFAQSIGVDDEIHRLVPDTNIRDKSQAVMDAVDAVLLHERHVNGYGGSHGITIYDITQASEKDALYAEYLKVDFALQTGWDEFLDAYAR